MVTVPDPRCGHRDPFRKANGPAAKSESRTSAVGATRDLDAITEVHELVEGGMVVGNVVVRL